MIGRFRPTWKLVTEKAWRKITTCNLQATAEQAQIFAIILFIALNRKLFRWKLVKSEI